MTLTLNDRPFQEDDELTFEPARTVLSLDQLSSEVQPEPLDGADATDLEASDQDFTGMVGEKAPVNAPEREPVRSDRSRDLVDSYFRDMGSVDMLSREEVVRLAKRIEAGRAGVIGSVFQIPLALRMVADWADQLSRGELRARDLVEMTPSQDNEEIEDTAGKDAAALEQREAVILPGLATQLEQILSLAAKLLSQSGGVRPDRVVRQLADEVKRPRLNQERLSDLLAVLDREHQALRLAEHKLGAKAISEVERAVGLSAAAFRDVMAELARSRTEIKLAQETLVRSHLRLAGR
jgi:DNA-directed RNA polymerase sigma subunit (sigma70/sigma32)